tara:strand:- start:1540 stop:2529 length:990 start_codon:yes stop_codon:yes gene_type:complete
MHNQGLKNKMILVTGGAGFIGSNLCEHFINSGSKVRCLDNLSTGNLANIENISGNKNFEFLLGDIRDMKICQEACKNIDFVLHQAALGSVPRSIKDPVLTNDVNITGFLNMLIASRDNNVNRFIYAASSSTYGDSEILPKVESKVGSQLSPYAISKFVNELYAKNFKLIYNLDTIGLRYFNVFGRRQNPNGEYAAVIPKFIKKMINNESPVINGDGSYSRDFTYIDNVIMMNQRAILVTDKRALNNVYNTAYGESTTIKDLFYLVKSYLKKYDDGIDKIFPIYGKVREGDVEHSLACIEKAKKLLNYSPEYNLSDGLKESIDWYYNNLK